ncbi:DUF4178 domain-containing protein [Intestinibacter sp.]|uniref:DUF4178 domain-containing protein n=1 Tax=Intestinibacter sp. TaxID=1965304 RepID=UPI003F18D2C8
MNEINLNSEVAIIDERFKCIEIVEYTYTEGSYTEYTLKSLSDKKVKWLEIENEEAYLYEGINRKKFDTCKGEFSSGKTYSGTSKVKSFSGNADVDLGEVVSFVEFYSSNDENVASIETWENGETEYSLGKRINIDTISVYQSYNSSNSNHSKKTALPIIGLVACMAIAFIIMIGINVGKNCGQNNCSPSNPAWCCTNTTKCRVTHEDCNAIRKSGSIRSGSSGFRRFAGGGLSFGK